MARTRTSAAAVAALVLLGAAVLAAAKEADPTRASIAWTRAKDPTKPTLDDEYYETFAKKLRQPTCAPGATLCGIDCVDLATSNTNCGACGNQCTAPATCVDGVCACAAGEFLCNGICQPQPCAATCTSAPGQPPAFMAMDNCVQGVMECFNHLAMSGMWLQDAQYPTYSTLLKVQPGAPSFGMWLEASRAARFDFYTIGGAKLHSAWVAFGNVCPADCAGCAAPLAPVLTPGFFYTFTKPVDEAFVRVEVSAPCGGANGIGSWSMAPICDGADVALPPPTPALMGAADPNEVSDVVRKVFALRAPGA